MKAKINRKDRFVIIMAGGKGERFWPLSRQKTPKQLISILGRKSFLQEAVARVKKVVPENNIIIITNRVQAAEVRRQLPELPRDNVVAEPCGRDTCAAVTLGAALVGARNPAGVMAVLPADHVIPLAKPFHQVLADAFNFAAQNPAIVTIGIKPTEAATGYGYIHFGKPIPPQTASPSSQTTFYKALKFVEKPGKATAQRYLKGGRHRWNAGMFIWSFTTILEALSEHQPEMAQACKRWMNCPTPAAMNRKLAREYPSIEKISIDFALMEKARNVVVADGTFPWDDLGAWTALERHLKADTHGNCSAADLVHVDSENNIIFDARTRTKTPVALVGIRDTIVVTTDDALLISSKHDAQKIKQLVAGLAGNPKHRKLA